MKQHEDFGAKDKGSTAADKVPENVESAFEIRPIYGKFIDIDLPKKQEINGQKKKKNLTVWKKKYITLEKEFATLQRRFDEVQGELANLQHLYLAVQSDAAAKQADLLTKMSHERKASDAKITLLEEDAASAKHLSTIRIKELEERNNTLEQQLIAAHEASDKQADTQMNLQRQIQEISAEANKKGAQQALKLLDAEHLQNELYKSIHEKDIELAEANKKQQEILEKYNAALMRMGEIIDKVKKARDRMKEISAEFDMYIIEPAAPATQDAETEKNAISRMEAERTPDFHGVTPQINKINIWQKIASFF